MIAVTRNSDPFGSSGGHPMDTRIDDVMITIGFILGSVLAD